MRSQVLQDLQPVARVSPQEEATIPVQSPAAPEAKTSETATALLRWWRRMVPAGSFRANVLTLMSGTALAQAAMVLFAPILTRLYGPADFALYAVFVAVASLVSAIAPGRYEFALMLQDEDDDAANVLVLALALSAGMSLVAVGVVAAFYFWLAEALSVSRGGGWIWLLPVGIFLYSWYNVAAKWQARGKRFRSMACADLGACVGALATQIGAGVFFTSVTGIHLVAGLLLGRCIAVVILCRSAGRDLFRLRGHLDRGRIRAAARRHWRFPVFSSTGILVGKAAHEVPKLMLAACFPAQVLGFFSLGMRVLGVPSTIIGQAIGHAFFPKIAKSRHDKARSLSLLLRACRNLLAAISLPMIILLFWGEWIFAFVFGSEWGPAGHFARLLIPMLAAQFVVGPVRHAMQAFEKQHVVLVWHTAFFCLSVAAFALGHALHSADVAILGYSAISAIMYAVYVVMCLYYSQQCGEPAAANVGQPAQAVAQSQ